MTIDTFLTKSGFIAKSELERAKLLAFYLYLMDNQPTVTIKEICNLFYVHGFSQPNTSRLKQNMIKSKSFVKGPEEGSFRLHKKELEELKKEHPGVDAKSEEIAAQETILPESLYKGAGSYIENLAKQINSSYHHDIYDGCAMLMRKLLKTLLVKSYEHLERRDEIEEGGHLKSLGSIIHYTLSKKVIAFNEDSIAVLDTVREFDNLAAHRIECNAKRSDIHKVQLEYRAVIEKLLYEANIKKEEVGAIQATF